MEALAADDGDGAATWHRVHAQLARDTDTKRWLPCLRFQGQDAGVAVLLAPTPFLRDWIRARYAQRITVLWQGLDSSLTRVVINVDKTAAPPATLAPASRTQKDASGIQGPLILDGASGDNELLTYSSPLDPAFTFESFVEGKSNEFAFAAARRVAEDDSPSFNPLFLHGQVGLGKTHLMHAIARRIKERTGGKRRVLFISADRFLSEFIRAMRERNTLPFKDRIRAVDVLMVDDVQFIARSDNTQEEFFHTFNVLMDRRRQIVVSADKSPNDLEDLEERLRSRLGWGMVAAIHATSYELRLGILQNKAGRMGLEIGDDVLEFLARRITTHTRDLEGALNRLSLHVSFHGKGRVVMDMVFDILQDLLRTSERRVSIEQIQRHVAEYYHIRLHDMRSARRDRAVARPRQIAMFLAKRLTPLSLPNIGRSFGRDHTTVMHALKRVGELCRTDAALAQDVENLRHRLGDR